MPAITPDFRTVSVPREQYLRKEETRIRDAALPIHNSDPTVAVHSNILFKIEEDIEVFETAETIHRNAGRHTQADEHKRRAAASLQLKFHHLDQLAHLLI